MRMRLAVKLQGQGLGSSRRRCGRICLRWEEPQLHRAGDDWWDEVCSWRPLAAIGKMCQEMIGGELVFGGDQPTPSAATSLAAEFPGRR